MRMKDDQLDMHQQLQLLCERIQPDSGNAGQYMVAHDYFMRETWFSTAISASVLDLCMNYGGPRRNIVSYVEKQAQLPVAVQKRSFFVVNRCGFLCLTLSTNPFHYRLAP